MTIDLLLRVMRIPVLISSILLAGCVSNGLTPQMRHQNVVTQMGAHMATHLAKAAGWGKESSNQTIMVSLPEIHMENGEQQQPLVTPQQLSHAFVHGLLLLPHAPHAIAWAPKETDALAPDQWILDSRMLSSVPINISDRQLYPYRLEMRLSRPGQRPLSLTVQGAFDGRALKENKPESDK